MLLLSLAAYGSSPYSLEAPQSDLLSCDTEIPSPGSTTDIT